MKSGEKMSQNKEASGSGERFQMVQPHRDLQLNWEVDVAKNLEEYLLKICSGEVTGEDNGHLSINFAEGLILFATYKNGFFLNIYVCMFGKFEILHFGLFNFVVYNWAFVCVCVKLKSCIWNSLFLVYITGV